MTSLSLLLLLVRQMQSVDFLNKIYRGGVLHALYSEEAFIMHFISKPQENQQDIRPIYMMHVYVDLL